MVMKRILLFSFAFLAGVALMAQGITRIESMAIIDSLENNVIKLRED